MNAEVDVIVGAVLRAGGEPWLVGGAVRDLIINPDADPKDYDLLVRGLPMDRLMASLPGRVELVGQSFGVIKVTINQRTIDVALPRTERSMGPGHRDFYVTLNHNLPVIDDLARRDFTMNAVAMHPHTGEFYDPFKGRGDIDRRLIKAVGDPGERISEDPLRMLRAVRFVARLGFGVDDDLMGAIFTYAPSVARVKPERVLTELDGILMGWWATAGIDMLELTSLIDHILPEWLNLVGFDQKNPHHDKDIANHVIYALHHAVSRGASLRTRWAVLLHDIAKPMTFTLDEHGHGHFYKHEDVGAEMAVTIGNRLRFPTQRIEDVAKMVAEHLNPPNQASDKVLRRYAARMGELTDDAMLCRESDLAAHAPPWPEKAVEYMDSYRMRLKALPEVRGFTTAQLAVHGGDIMTIIPGIRGPDIGRMKEAATKLIIDGELPNEHRPIIEWMQDHWQHILGE